MLKFLRENAKNFFKRKSGIIRSYNSKQTLFNKLNLIISFLFTRDKIEEQFNYPFLNILI